VLARPRHEHSFMTFVPEVLCGNPNCAAVLGAPPHATARHLFRDHEGPRERAYRERVSRDANSLLRERAAASLWGSGGGSGGGDHGDDGNGAGSGTAASSIAQGGFWAALEAHRDASDGKWEAAHRPPPHAGRCSGCAAQAYCSPACAQTDWPRHNVVCRAAASR
jgi:hypothetical protein